MAAQSDHAVHTRPASLVKSAKELAAGTLQVTHSHLKWSPSDELAAQPLSLALHLISGLQKAKGQPVLRVSTASAAKIFRLESVEERDAFVEVLTPLKDAAVASAAASSGTAASRSLPAPALQKDIFEKHPDVKELYTRLVASGYISEAEFWSSKQPLVRASETSSKTQRKGMSTAMLTLLGAGINSATATINVNISADITSQIFAESPAVRIAYQATVPHVKSREAFWDEYFRYVQRKLEKRRKRATGTMTATDDLLSEFEEMLHKYESDAAKSRPTQRQTLAWADPTLNIAADGDDSYGNGYGFAHQPGREDARTGKAGGRADDIMHELNQHAAVVLSGRPSNTPAAGSSTAAGATSDACDAMIQGAHKARSHGAIALEDLQDEVVPELIELKINDPNKYFHRQTSEATASTSQSTAQRQERGNQLQAAAAKPAGEAALDASLAYAVLHEMMSGASQDGEIEPEYGLPRNPATGLIPQMLEGLRKQVLSTNELLRHFWRGFPLNTAAKVAKMQRVNTALKGIYDQTMAMQTAAHGMDRVHVTQVLRPVLRAMDAAFTRLDDDPLAKKAKIV